MSTPAPVDFKIIDVICDLIKAQLALPQERVWIYNQKARIPDSPGLFVEVVFNRSKPFAATSVCRDDAVGNFTEYQSTNVQETYTVELYSRDESAFTRSPEIIFALTGARAQQAQETYGFKFGDIPTDFHDLSFIEASARLFRQAITFNALRPHNTERVIEYFDKFSIPPSIHVNQ
jgi:hypothetical protein